MLGIEIPEQLLTKTVKETDWRIEPLPTMEHTNPLWIGDKLGMVSFSIVRLLFSKDERGLGVYRKYLEKKIVDNITEMESGWYSTGSKYAYRHDSKTLAWAKKELLSDLRTMFLVDCLLCKE